METQLCDEICRYVREEPGNRFPGSDQPYFDQPLIGLVAADDPLFLQYKQIIGPFHCTPREFLSTAATVISWVLPITRATRESNRRQTTQPSLQWAQTRSFGDEFIMELRRHLVNWLEPQGHQAVAPLLAPEYQRLTDTPVGLASSWSERHVGLTPTFELPGIKFGVHLINGLPHDVMLPTATVFPDPVQTAHKD